MGRRTQERRTDRASADEVAKLEQQLWEFAKRPDPPTVPEAKLRPGAFLYRTHRVWHSLGRGSGIASHSFRALRDELLKRDPPVRNLQPKLYGASPLSQSDASTLIDVILETWHVARGKGPGWEATALPRQTETESGPADAHDVDAIRENLLHTLFKGEDTLLLEEPVGVPPEVFFEERGRASRAVILPTKGETVSHFSPSNAYGGFSELIGRFFENSVTEREESPLLIWILRLPSIRDNPEFHQAFHVLAVYSAAITNWYFRLNRASSSERSNAELLWKTVISRSAFVVHGLPVQSSFDMTSIDTEEQFCNIDQDLFDLDLEFFLPNNLPIKFQSLPEVRKHRGYAYDLTVSIEMEINHEEEKDKISYWLFPERPMADLDETAVTTGLPVIGTDISPGQDFDLAYKAVYNAVAFRFGLANGEGARRSAATLSAMGWKILSIPQLQACISVGMQLQNNT